MQDERQNQLINKYQRKLVHAKEETSNWYYLQENQRKHAACEYTAVSSKAVQSHTSVKANAAISIGMMSITCGNNLAFLD